MTCTGRRRTGRLLAALLALGATSTGCAGGDVALPHCRPDQRLAIVAQSVPSATYVPCITALPDGWALRAMDVDDRGTTVSLRSDRSDRPLSVSLVPACDPAEATPVAPRAEGVRTLQRLRSISPTYAGTLFDVFPGGCVVYEFDLPRGAHIALTEELLRTVRLYSRRELRQELGDDLGVTLDR